MVDDTSEEIISVLRRIGSLTYINIQNFIKELVQFGGISNSVLKNLAKASGAELDLIVDIVSFFKEYIDKHPDEERKIDELLMELLKGGHIVFYGDDGGFYEEWKKKEGVKSRKGKSSHKSVDEQFSIGGPFLKEALFGTKKDELGNKCTWLQLESHSTDLWHLLAHLISYIIYKFTGKNVGPYGRSKYVEKSPLELRGKKPAP